MKRFHVHISVDSIAQSTQFYSALFGQAPTVLKTDYAKWMLDDPLINFAISERAAKVGQAGLDHLGFQMDSAPQLHAMTASLQSAGLAVSDLGETTCCYAKSDKGWVHDPQGIAWESFVTMGEATTYGTESAEDISEAGSAGSASGACCAPSGSAASLAVSCTPTVKKVQMSLADIAVQPAASSCGTSLVSGVAASAATGSAKACC